MITRRDWLMGGAALAGARLCSAQARQVLLIWSPLLFIPRSVALRTVTLPRAYAAAARADQNRRAVVTGRFPHIAKASDPTLATVMGNGRYREVELPSEAEIDRLLAATPRETVIVYIGSPKLAEDTYRDAAVRVPLAIGAGTREGTSAAELLFSSVDVLPTVLSLAGVALPEGVQGRDHSARLRSGSGDLPDSVWIEGRLGMAGEWRALVRGYEKLVISREEEPIAQFNLADDPEELTDMARDSAQRLTRDALLALARVWMRRVRDGYTESGLKLR